MTMHSTRRPTTFAILGLAVLLVGSALIAGLPSFRAAPAVGPSPAAATYTLTLYGSSLVGWGFTAASISNPGPDLVMFVGDTVTLHLFANDNGVTHTWYIDLNHDNMNNTGDISAGSFNNATVAHVFTFTVPNSPGTYQYFCEIHPSVMHGTLKILAAPTYVLYGSGTAGWGTSPATITNPGPTLSAHQGDVITLELVSQDGVGHTFFIDVDHNGATPDSSDPQSGGFGGSASTVTSWSYTVAAAPGNYTYYCGVHGTMMEGSFRVLSTQGTPAGGPPDYTLYAAAIVIIVVIAIVALVVIRRKPRMPPTPPQP